MSRWDWTCAIRKSFERRRKKSLESALSGCHARYDVVQGTSAVPEILTHPPQEQLTAFGLGKLDSEQASWVEQHLESCADCCVALSDLRDDSFVGLVRQCDPSSQTAGTIGLDAGTTVTRGGLPAELARHARYEVLELIGRGGMGDVYEAQHKVMQRQVALKVIKPELIRNEAAVRRFQREVQAAARLQHTHIVTAHDAEQAGDAHFLVMEYVDGVNLDEVVRRRGPLPVADACRFIRQAAEGLQHAHELGMVHRDIKPHNLMLSSAGVVKNPGLPVFLDVADGVDLSNAEIAEGFAEVRRVAKATGAEVRLGPEAKPQAAVNKPSTYFERVAKVPGPSDPTWTTLESVVRERVGGGPGRRVTSERIPQPAGRLRYEAQIDGVGSKIIDNVFVDLKDILMRDTDARVIHEGERGVDLRLFRYTTPTRNGEVRLTLTSRELGGQPADESQKWLLKVEVTEWNKGEGQGAPAVLRVERQAQHMKLYLDGAPLSREEVLARIDALATGDPGFQVRVEGDVVPVQADVLDFTAAIGATAVGEKNVKFPAEVTTRVMDEAVRRGKQMGLLYGNWTETTDERRGPVHTLRILKNGEFHEAGPMVISIAGGTKQWVTKDLDGDRREDIVPFQMSGSWTIKEGHLHTETTSSNVLGFKNERPGNQRKFRIETLTKDKLVLVLIEDGKDVDRWTAFREVSKAPRQQP